MIYSSLAVIFHKMVQLSYNCPLLVRKVAEISQVFASTILNHLRNRVFFILGVSGGWNKLGVGLD